MKREPRAKKMHDLISRLTQENELTKTDPFGSYTGKPADPFEEPEQDPDDL